MYAVYDAQKSQIINIVRRSLSYIDKRLVDHGDRVAYIAGKIALCCNVCETDMDRLLILCLLHDIGAYKTEEIDDMVNFETDSAMNHSVYGYAFLNNATTLGEDAKAILYHHTHYDKFGDLDERIITLAQLIFLADRIDILLGSANFTDWTPITRLSGTAFSPELVDAFLTAEGKYNISGHILDMTYAYEVIEKINNMHLTGEEIYDYLKMLVFSIDFRSPFTVTHTANTAVISDTLAELMGIDERGRDAIARGALLHDIGKIGIPYSILEKPDKLTDEEMDIMRTHVELSETILRGIVSDEICRIAVRHHEKLNGKGYHKGLSAIELSLPERIVAVSDVLSALINRRSYKDAFPREKTIAILTSMRDSGDLCPEVVNTALENYDRIIEVTTRANDPVIKQYEKIRAQYSELSASL